MSIGVGVVGLGRISTLHLRGYQALSQDRVRVVAVCDVDSDRAATIAGQTGSRAVTFDEMLADDNVDAVEILVPSFAQPELALSAIAAGKAVTVQKPLAGDLATGRRIVEAAEAAGVALRVFENTVNAPAWRLAERIVADGTIGTPLSIYMRWANSLLSCGWDVPAEAWSWRLRGPWSDRFAAPSLFDDSAHLLSPAIALFGPVARVVALSGEQEVRGRRTGFPYAVAWHHIGGGQAVVEGTLCDELVVLTDEYSADTSITITGSAGLCWINTGEGRAAERPTVEVATGGRLTRHDVDHRWSAAWAVAQADWVAALTDGSGFRWTGRQALDVLSASLLVDDAVRVARQSSGRESP